MVGMCSSTFHLNVFAFPIFFPSVYSSSTLKMLSHSSFTHVSPQPPPKVPSSAPYSSFPSESHQTLAILLMYLFGLLSPTHISAQNKAQMHCLSCSSSVPMQSLNSIHTDVLLGDWMSCQNLFPTLSCAVGSLSRLDSTFPVNGCRPVSTFRLFSIIPQVILGLCAHQSLGIAFLPLPA